MKRPEYKRLKISAEEQYQKAIQDAGKDRIETLAAIEKVWEMMNPRLSGTAPKPTEYGSLVVAVHKALRLVPEKFTRKDVLAAMGQGSPEVAAVCNQNSLSGCLHRLKNEGFIAEIKKGRGSSPSKYILAEQPKKEGE